MRFDRRLKAICAALLALLVLLACIGCGANVHVEPTGGEPEPTAESEATLPMQTDVPEQSNEPARPQEPEQKSNVLVVYFSRTGEQYGVGVIETGNTAIVAGMIAETLQADVFEIVPEPDTYPTTYDELTDVAKREQNENARPTYAGEAPDLSGYDTVFLGAPVWWGDWPMILYTFFETNRDALKGKTLIPFCTHEGSGLSEFDRKLSAACPDSTVGEGLAIRGSDAQNSRDSVKEQVDGWLSGLGY